MANTFQDLLNMALSTEPTVSPLQADIEEDEGLPVVVLPKGEYTISAAGEELGQLLSAKHTHFTRGTTVVVLGKNIQGKGELVPVNPQRLASDFEQVARLVQVNGTDEDVTLKPCICRAAEASLILESQAFQEQLPPLRMLSRTPVLVEDNGKLKVVSGYDRGSGILALGAAPQYSTLPEAVELLKSLLVDFRFSSASDRSRAVAALITPALTFGGLLSGRAPVDLAEADQSQAGKGYRHKITAAIYGYTPIAVSQQKKGVGSLEESLDRALIAGYNFISIDNVRGQLDSPKIESLLTEDIYFARSAYMPQTEIDPKRVCLMFTSNKADITKDFANRSSCVRLLKQPDGYQFKKFAEGDLLYYVRAHQSVYLGAVFAVIAEWHRQGKPRTSETRHSFRSWAQIFDWIVQEIFGEAPLLDGHCETQQRMTNPYLNWLRDVSLAVTQQKRDGQWLTTSQILEIISEHPDVEIPGLKPGENVFDTDCHKAIIQQMGRKFSKCFKESTSIELDGIQITRNIGKDAESHPLKSYCFTLIPSVDLSPDQAPASATKHTDITEGPRIIPHISALPPDRPSDGPLTAPLVEMAESADPVNGSGISHKKLIDELSRTTAIVNTNDTISGSAGNSGPDNNELYEEVVFE